MNISELLEIILLLIEQTDMDEDINVVVSTHYVEYWE